MSWQRQLQSSREFEEGHLKSNIVANFVRNGVVVPNAPLHGQEGIRPAVLVQDDPFILTVPTVLIVPFTGTRSTSRFPGTVIVQPDGQNGLTVSSVAPVFQMRVVDQRNCRRRLGVLDATTLDQIFSELDKLIGR